MIQLNPKRIEDETTLMREVIRHILQEGCTTGMFHHVDLETDIEVFAYAIAYFFPIAGKQPDPPPEEEKLLAVVNWFIQQWKRS